MSENNVNKLANENKVVFVSSDGVSFKIFVDGKELVMTTGISIVAGNEASVEVTPTLLAHNGLDTFKEV